MVLWHPQVCPHVLPLEALPGDSRDSAASVDLSAFRCRTTMLILADGSAQHILFQDHGRALQLVVAGASALGPVRLLTDAWLPPHGRTARLAALESLNDLCHLDRLSLGHFPPDAGGRRFRIVLQALDGWLAGAAYRDIAVALFGRLRVEADWSDPRDHLRDQVRRAIRRGRALMTGGYLNLLRGLLLWMMLPDVF